MVKLRYLVCVFAFVACGFFVMANQSSIGAYAPQDNPTKSVGSQITDKDRAIIGRSTHSVWFDASDGTIATDCHKEGNGRQGGWLSSTWT